MQFRSPPGSLYRGVHGLIVVFSIFDRMSFNNVGEWVKEFNRYIRQGSHPVIVIVGNKMDRADSRVVTVEEANAKATELGAIAYIETNCVSGEGVDQVFECITQKLLQSDPKWVQVAREKRKALQQGKSEINQPCTMQ